MGIIWRRSRSARFSSRLLPTRAARHRAFQRTARPRRTTHGLFSPVRQQISDCFPRHAEAQLHQSPKRRPTPWRLLLKGYMYSAHMANSNVQHGPGAHTGFSARFDSTYEIALDRTRAVPKHSSILFRTISLFTDLSVAFVISPRLAPKQRIIALHRWRLSHLRGAGILSVSQRGHCGQLHVRAVVLTAILRN